MGAFALISLGLEILPKAIAAGIDVSRVISVIVAAHKTGTVQDGDWDHLHEIEDELRKRLHSDTE